MTKIFSILRTATAICSCMGIVAFVCQTPVLAQAYYYGNPKTVVQPAASYAPAANSGYSITPAHGSSAAGTNGYAHAANGVGTMGFNCNHCGYSSTNPPAQPQVAGGRCPACTVAVDCADNCGSPQTFRDLHPYNFQPLAHGEFMGPIRVPSTIDYRIRVGDVLRFIFVQSQEIQAGSFRLQVGDQVQISSLIDADVKLGDLAQGIGIEIQPNGALYLNTIGEIHAAGQTIPQLRGNLNEAYSKYIKEPSINVIPIKTNSLLQNILDSVDARSGVGGRNHIDTVHADGTVRLPKLGPICVLGMTVDELKREVNLRYREIVSGLEIEPIIDQEAGHVVIVYGEVAQPGRFDLTGPTTVTGALALAGGINTRGNKRDVVIFRRAEDWRLIVTKVDLAAVHLGKAAGHPDEIWVRDNDLLIVPPTPITRLDDFVDQVFTRGIYSVLPFAQVGEGFNANVFNQ